jgi:hypothetical protein
VSNDLEELLPALLTLVPNPNEETVRGARSKLDALISETVAGDQNHELD